MVHEVGIMLNYFIFTWKVDKGCHKDCKEILVESVTTQYTLMTLDVCVGRWRRNDGGRGNIRIMWWNLIGGKQVIFRDTMVK